MPFFAGSEIGVEFYLTVMERFEFLLVEAPLPCFCKPEIVGDKSSGDDSGFFAFDNGDWCFVVCGEEVFSEEALVEAEWLDVEGFVYPGYVVEGVFDSFAASDVVVLL